MSAKDVTSICSRYKISRITAKKYINMQEEEIQEMDKPRKYKHSANRKANAYVNIIYKMMRDGYTDDIIYFYLRYIGIQDSSSNIWIYMSCISQNNFPGRKKIHPLKMRNTCYCDDVRVIKRNEVLRYLLTVNPKIKRNKIVEENIDLIREYYPTVRWTEEVFHTFHSALMGKNPSQMDKFLEKYTGSLIKGFCESIKKDIVPVKNAISLEVSSGFVEGNNNKFKLIKRIVYGRAKLVNLSKKCSLAFMSKIDNFELSKLI